MREGYMTSIDWAIVAFYANNPNIEAALKLSATLFAAVVAYYVVVYLYEGCDEQGHR